MSGDCQRVGSFAQWRGGDQSPILSRSFASPPAIAQNCLMYAVREAISYSAAAPDVAQFASLIALHRAVSRKRGSNPADNFVQICKFCARPSGSGSPACPKPLGRCASAPRALSTRHFVSKGKYNLKKQ